MYAQFLRLASEHVDEINNRLSLRGWHTSQSKVIDNAIVGYMLLHGKPTEAARPDVEPGPERRGSPNG
jgi:hypothetical protein